MVFIFDTSSLQVLGHFDPDTFPTLWDRIELMVSSGLILSTRDVQRELANLDPASFLAQRLKTWKNFFSIPNNDEAQFVASIFGVPHFSQIIGAQQQAKGSPVADPFVIAAAKIRNGAVVTQELWKPHAAKIPNVCEHFKIQCYDLKGFMKLQGWKF